MGPTCPEVKGKTWVWESISMDLLDSDLDFWRKELPCHRVRGRLSWRWVSLVWRNRKGDSRCWTEAGLSQAFNFSWFYFKNISDIGNVCDLCCQNSRWQSNNQNFTAAIHWIKFLVFSVSIHLPFNTSVCTLQWHLTPAYKKNFRKIKITTIFISQNLSCISSNNYCCYFLARAHVYFKPVDFFLISFPFF